MSARTSPAISSTTTVADSRLEPVGRGLDDVLAGIRRGEREVAGLGREAGDIGEGARSTTDIDAGTGQRAAVRAGHDPADDGSHLTPLAQAFQATMLLNTGLTIRVPLLLVVPPYAWIAMP